MNKILTIRRCNDCYFFDDEYCDYNETSTQLNRTIETVDGDNYPIPDDCPLPTQEDS